MPPPFLPAAPGFGKRDALSCLCVNIICELREVLEPYKLRRFFFVPCRFWSSSSCPTRFLRRFTSDLRVKFSERSVCTSLSSCSLVIFAKPLGASPSMLPSSVFCLTPSISSAGFEELKKSSLMSSSFSTNPSGSSHTEFPVTI